MIRFSCAVEAKGIWHLLADPVHVLSGPVHPPLKEPPTLMPLDKQHLDLVLQSLEVDLGLVPSPALHRKSRQKLLFPGVFDESGRKKELWQEQKRAS